MITFLRFLLFTSFAVVPLSTPPTDKREGALTRCAPLPLQPEFLARPLTLTLSPRLDLALVQPRKVLLVVLILVVLIFI